VLAGDGSHSTDQPIGKSIGPWHRQSRVLREITWNKSHNARLSMLILSKAYPFHGILSHVTRL
jgi:hypothetical protein